jgi:hypothetical protein
VKKLFLAGAMLAITSTANAGLPLPTSLFPDALMPSVRGDRDDRRYYDDDRRDRGRHRGHYKKRYHRRDRGIDAPGVPVPVPVVPPNPHLPAPPLPPLPPGAPRPPGF